MNIINMSLWRIQVFSIYKDLCKGYVAKATQEAEAMASQLRADGDANTKDMMVYLTNCITSLKNGQVNDAHAQLRTMHYTVLRPKPVSRGIFRVDAV